MYAKYHNIHPTYEFDDFDLKFIHFLLTDWFEDLFAWLNYLIPRPKSNLRNGSMDGFHVHLSSSLTCYDISLENFQKIVVFFIKKSQKNTILNIFCNFAKNT